MISAGLAALLFTACGAPNGAGVADHAGDDGSTAQSEAAPGMAEDLDAVEESADGPQNGGSGSAVGSDVTIEDRDLIHTAELTVRVDDVSEASDAAKGLTIEAGGYVASEHVSTPTGGSPDAALTLRIPNEGYEGALAELAELGDRSNLDRSVEDVTEEVADVESRVESAEASLETLRGYLEEAEDVDDLLRVEREIQSRQSELESFQARLKSLSNLTAYSTVHLSLMPPETYLEERTEESIGFLGGLERGWRALVTIGEGIAVAAGWLLPFLVVVAVIAAAPLWWWRTRRARRTGVEGASGEGAPPQDTAKEKDPKGSPEAESGGNAPPEDAAKGSGGDGS